MSEAHVIYLISRIKYGNSRLEKAEALGKLADHEFWVQCRKLKIEHAAALSAPLDYLILGYVKTPLQ